MLQAVKDALLTVGVPVSHFYAAKKPDKYIVWSEDGQGNSEWADGKMVNQAIEGTIDYFTKSENDPNFAAIQSALNDAGIAFRLGSIQYEDETGFIHYEWIFEVG